MHPILLKVTSFLDKVSRGESPGMSEDIIEQAGEELKSLLRERFNEGEENDFTLRLSNLGSDTCKLQQAKVGGDKVKSTFFPMQMLIGDLIEIAGIAVLKASGNNVHDEQKEVVLDIAGEKIKGHIDFKIDRGTWDMKSASPYSFTNKFQNFYKLRESDDFGYIAQGVGYDEAQPDSGFEGWVVVNKSTGEWNVLEVPEWDWDQIKVEELKVMENNVRTIMENKPFERGYEDEPETFRKIPTGNRVLPRQCEWCDFKRNCWPNAVHKPNPKSKAVDRKWKWYTKYTATSED